MGLCLMMIKPDAMNDGTVGKVIKMVEEKGYIIRKAKTINLTYAQAKELYIEHRGKDFFDRNIDFIVSDTVLVLIFNHPRMTQEKAIKELRNIAGATDLKDASAWTIRKLCGTELPKNAVHVSDSIESFNKEIKILFGE